MTIIKDYFCRHCNQYRSKWQTISKYSVVQGQSIKKCKYCNHDVINVKDYITKILKEVENGSNK
ncbi:hypothetical protein [Segatella bryantii]|uniref:hypothetical protein n=1 Tax=Segatella bryantii TaxID=77095 RepID=UPI00242F5B04|nr:hypothetical protein [Segatella bryantii]